MDTAPKNSTPRNNPLLDDQEYQLDRKSVEGPALPEYVTRHLQASEPDRIRGARKTTKPSRPMFLDPFLCLFSIEALGFFMFASVGLMVTGWTLMFWLVFGAIGGVTTAFYFGLPVCASGTLTFGYIASYGLAIIESTSWGAESFQVESISEWKEWIWNLWYLLVLILQACVVGYGVQLLFSPDSWSIMVAVAYLIFPFVLLGALAAEGAWFPLALGTVLRSLVQVGRAWVLFYVETTPLAIAWTLLLHKGLAGYSPWMTPVYTAPLLALLILIYVRLIGKVAGRIMVFSKTLSQGERDGS